ncbi:hypothetical protein EK21DRAFT_110994 [Setomelanomma holmii]|uniref:Gpi anchored protein n=1 Tax=Setomelanomma holmii TaxID=210430 RepID=A0A9P4LLD1_9PLEO|nr:hypothetical protein EK21DRAFT_110994 [Setomelanomma holmii]
MLFQKLAIFSALEVFAAAQDINQDDIPQQCTAVCVGVVSISRRCDDTTNDDRAELDCICRAPNANVLVPACEACVAEFDNDDTDMDDNSVDDNDVLEVLTRCNFTTTAYNTASAQSILSSVASSFASASGSVAVITSGTVVRTTSIAAQTSVPQQSTAVSPIQTAAMGLGALGLAMQLL